MNIRPVASKDAIVQPQSNEQSAKARAVAAFNKVPGAQVQTADRPGSQHPAQLDQNALGAEDLGSLNIPSPNIRDKDSLSEESSEAIETSSEAPKEQVDPALSRQFAQLARQEKALRARVQQQEQSYRQREADLKAREAAISIQAQAPSVDLSKYIPRERLQQDPLGVLAESEISYDSLTQQIINRQPVDPQVQRTIDDLKAQISDLKKYNEDGKKSQVDQQAAQYKAAVQQISMDAKALIKSDPVAYEAISKTGTVRDVVKLIEETYAKDGILMSVEDAAKEVEDYLVEENYKMATKIDKIRKRIGQVAPEQASVQPRPANPPQSQMKTLTNATASSRKLTNRERALLAFEGKLK